MDSEVFIGLISAGSALGGALLGAVGAVLAGRRQAMAVQYQTDAQRKDQHEQWLRERLLERYLEVLPVVGTWTQLLDAQVCVAEDRRQEAHDLLLRISQHGQVLDRHEHAIKMEAPSPVVQAYEGLQRLFVGTACWAEGCLNPSVSVQELLDQMIHGLRLGGKALTEFAEATRTQIRPDGEPGSGLDGFRGLTAEESAVVRALSGMYAPSRVNHHRRSDPTT